MTSLRLAQILGTLLTLAVIFIGCNDFGRVTQQTKQVAKDLLESGRQAGVLGQRDSSGQPPAAVGPGVNQMHGTPVYWQVPRDQSLIAIGTFNIQVFGTTKLGKPDVVRTLVQIVRQFDCLAIQELRSQDDTIIPRFVEMINSDGSQYNYVVGPRQGNSSSTEQYVFIYDTNRIVLVDSGFVVPDPQNVLHREPLVTRFRTRTADPRQAFSFALANVHVDPDVTQVELSALTDVYVWLQQYLRDEDDIIMLGDFNEPPSRYGRLWQLPNLVSALPNDVTTNTKRTRAYDNLLLDQRFTSEFSGHAGVLDFGQAFGLNYDQARAVSDHLPVWALFSSSEARAPQYAQQPQVSSR